jgi:CPA2 family monovalent cation:H+ antiporter-2
MPVPCLHLTNLPVDPIPEGGCAQCLAMGDTWVHLRFCVACGNVGCCDSSKNRHARKHAEGSSHPVVRSAEPGESWAYCFADDVTVRVNPL